MFNSSSIFRFRSLWESNQKREVWSSNQYFHCFLCWHDDHTHICMWVGKYVRKKTPLKSPFSLHSNSFDIQSLYSFLWLHHYEWNAINFQRNNFPYGLVPLSICHKRNFVMIFFNGFGTYFRIALLQRLLWLSGAIHMLLWKAHTFSYTRSHLHTSKRIYT